MSIKYFLLFLFQLSFSITGLVQDKATDSLKMLLGKQKDDTSQIQMLLVLSRKFEDRNMRDSAIFYAQQALKLSDKGKHPIYQIRSLLRLNNLFRESGDYPKALEFAFQGLRLSEKSKDTMNIYNSYRYICFTYNHLNDVHKMLQYARKNKQLVNTGCFNKEKNPEHYHFSGYLSIMAGAFEKLNFLDSALYYRRLSYKAAGRDKKLMALVNIGLAEIYSKLENTDSAFMYFRQAVDYAKGRREDLIPIAQLGMAKLFVKKKMNDSAVHYANLSLNMAQEIKAPSHELDAVSFLHELYSENQLIDSAYKYLNITMTLKDSLYDYEKIKRIENLGYTETLRLQQLEQAREEARQQYAYRVRIYSLIAGLLVLIMVAYILYKNNKQKERANLLLHRKQQELENTLEDLKTTQAQLVQREKLASLGALTAGIAHEIENPLNFVNNFSEVNQELITELKNEVRSGNADEAIAIANDIEENEQKIAHHGKRADAIVKSMLQHTRAGTGKKELTDINALADEYLRLCYQALRSKDKSFSVSYETCFDESIGKIAVVPQDIGRVLLNLFNNAFYSVNKKKKQLNGAYEPEVSISTKKMNGKVEIRVKDNGTGIPQKVVDKIFQPFFTTKPTGEGTGLGLSLSYDIITKGHGGELKVNTLEGEYAEFKILLPVN